MQKLLEYFRITFGNIRNFERLYGWRSLLIMFTVYWAQGFKQFGTLAITFYYKDVLKLSSSATQILLIFTHTAWFIKPIYGLASDNIPILGYHRKPYLVIAGIAGLISYLGFVLISNAFIATACLVLGSFGGALSDVIADAIMVQKQRLDPQGGAASLQTFCMVSMAVGGLIGIPAGGIALEYMKPEIVITIMAVSPGLLLVASFFLDETKVETKIQLDQMKYKLGQLYDGLKDPQLLKPIAFIFFSTALSPSFVQLMVYFMNEELEFSPSFISLLNMIAYMVLANASLLYNSCLKHLSYVLVIAIGQVLLAITNLSDLALVTHANREIYVSDELFALTGDALQDVVGWTFRLMPLLTLTAQLCPESVEASMFATVMSIFNIGNALAAFLGSGLQIALGVDKDDYSLIWVLMLIKSVTKLFPLAFICLLPARVKDEDVLGTELGNMPLAGLIDKNRIM